MPIIVTGLVAVQQEKNLYPRELMLCGDSAGTNARKTAPAREKLYFPGGPFTSNTNWLPNSSFTFPVADATTQPLLPSG
jgi:hypothetical protein